ncbi:MAG TPA: lipoyl domain-containing protein [Candidatus Udaeobacter sp.]|nr:lipoyl domain-containing protein [Candidatus Udaeobacter sp.]
MEVETDKVDVEIESPDDGFLTEIKAQEGKTVRFNFVCRDHREGRLTSIQVKSPLPNMGGRTSNHPASSGFTESFVIFLIS